MRVLKASDNIGVLLLVSFFVTMQHKVPIQPLTFLFNCHICLCPSPPPSNTWQPYRIVIEPTNTQVSSPSRSDGDTKTTSHLLATLIPTFNRPSDTALHRELFHILLQPGLPWIRPLPVTRYLRGLAASVSWDTGGYGPPQALVRAMHLIPSSHQCLMLLLREDTTLY